MTDIQEWYVLEKADKKRPTPFEYAYDELKRWKWTWAMNPANAQDRQEALITRAMLYCLPPLPSDLTQDAFLIWDKQDKRFIDLAIHELVFAFDPHNVTRNDIRVVQIFMEDDGYLRYEPSGDNEIGFLPDRFVGVPNVRFAMECEDEDMHKALMELMK